VIRAGVRCRNQQEALQRGHRDQTKGSVGFQLTQDYLGQSLALYEQTKAQYQQRFAQLCRRLRPLQILITLPGIGRIGAVTIAAYVVDAHRFLRRGHYLSYCGLVTHEKRSGGKSYGRRRGRYNHALKAVYKMAALAVLRSTNSPFRPYIEHLRAAGCAEYNVRHALARLLATISLGMLKHGQRFDVHQLTWYEEEAPANS
jgi:transposase